MEDNKNKYRDMNGRSQNAAMYSLMLLLKNEIEELRIQLRTIKKNTERNEQG